MKLFEIVIFLSISAKNPGHFGARDFIFFELHKALKNIAKKA